MPKPEGPEGPEGPDGSDGSEGPEVSEWPDGSEGPEVSEWPDGFEVSKRPWGLESSELVFFGKKRFDREDFLRAKTEKLGTSGVGASFKRMLNDGTIIVVERVKETAYKAVLEDGTVVVVKVMKEAEIIAWKALGINKVGEMQHKNLVPLCACAYLDDDRYLLIYDYLPVGSLWAHLHEKASSLPSLDWIFRVRIAIGAARGLAYLHTVKNVTHGNIKSTNVLLTSELDGCISDGLDWFSSPNVARGAPRNSGYEAPEMAVSWRGERKKDVYSCSLVNQKTDVYSFGVILLELLTGKSPAALRDIGSSLPEWVLVRLERPSEIFDKQLMERQNWEEEMLQMLLQIAMQCVEHAPAKRPSMDEVVKLLENIRQVFDSGNNSDKVNGDTMGNENGNESDNSTVQRKRTRVINDGFFQRIVTRFKGRRKLFFREELQVAVSPGTTTLQRAVHASLVQENAELENMKERLVSSELKHLDCGAREFTYQQLIEATGGFTNKIGSGGFGTVFKGTLQGVGAVAVKVIKRTKQSLDDAKQLVAEVQVIGRLRHANIVPLRGWCYDEGVMLLVYEFVDNGDLHTHLFPQSPSEPLSWEKRIKALQGVASALVFLHKDFGSKERVIHRDIKPMNVMLDAEFNARLGDFGLARLSKLTAPRHQSESLAFTPGYVAPEYNLGATTQTDVYSFGILILVVATGRKPLDSSIPGWPGLVKWVRDFYDEGRIVEAGDPALCNGSEFSVRDKEEMEVVLQLGLSCCVYEPSQRPTMREAYVALHPRTRLFASLPPQFPTPVELPSLENLMISPSDSGASWPTGLSSKSSIVQKWSVIFGQ